MGWACSTYEEKRDVYRVLVWKPNGRNLLGDQRVDESIILQWISRKLVLGALTVSICRRIGTGARHL
jgi:hypothetical protein